MAEADSALQQLRDANALREPLLRSVIQALQLPLGSSGLDAGCGIGLQALLLAEAVGPDGHITGLDRSSAMLAVARETVARARYASRIALREADVRRLPFDDGSFEWVWSADCIGYPAGDLPPLLSELARVLRPGGRVMLLAWSAQQLLPGHPFLEARLNATCSGYLPFLAGQPPEQHFPRAMRAFHAAGWADVRAQTFVRTLQAPLTPEERHGLFALFAMLWGQPQVGVSPEDWDAYQRLCQPESPECILDLPEYYGFFTYSLFEGSVVA